MNPIAQFFDALFYLREAPDFIRKHQLWKGYWKRSWMAKGTVFLGAIITIVFFINIGQGIQQLASTSTQAESVNMSMLTEKIYFQGGIKYLLLIVLEMLIFHFSVRTIEVLSGEDSEVKIKDFIDAQIRMIKISIRNYLMEIILGTLISIALGIAGANYLKSFFTLLLQFYFIGFAFMDNYYEQYGQKIKESAKYIRNHMVAATTIGAVGYFLFMIPLVGAIIAPFICAVAATSYLYYKSGKEDEPMEALEGNLVV